MTKLSWRWHHYISIFWQREGRLLPVDQMRVLRAFHCVEEVSELRACHHDRFSSWRYSSIEFSQIKLTLMLHSSTRRLSAGDSAKDFCHPGEFLPSRIRIRVTHRDGPVDMLQTIDQPGLNNSRCCVTTPYAMRATEVG